MLRKTLSGVVTALSVMGLAACSSTQYSPVATQAAPIDVTEYAKNADTFMVLLDTSGSMNNDDQGRPRIYDAQDWTASFEPLRRNCVQAGGISCKWGSQFK